MQLNLQNQSKKTRIWTSFKLFILVLAYVLDVHFLSMGLLLLGLFMSDPVGDATKQSLPVVASACYAITFFGALFYVVRVVHPKFLSNFFSHLLRSKARQRALLSFSVLFIFGFVYFYSNVSSPRNYSGTTYTIGFYLGLMRDSLLSSLILALVVTDTIYASRRFNRVQRMLSLRKHMAAESCLLSWHFIWRSFLLFLFIALCILFGGWLKIENFFDKLIVSVPLMIKMACIFCVTSLLSGFAVTDTVIRIRKSSSLSLPELINSDWCSLKNSWSIHLRLFARSLSLVVLTVFAICLLWYLYPTYSAVLALCGFSLLACTFYSLWTLLHEPAFHQQFEPVPSAPPKEVEVVDSTIIKHCVLRRGESTPEDFGVRDFPGCDISQLKPSVDFSEALSTIGEISKAGSHLHLLLVGACLYSVIAACNVAEADFISGTASIKLPAADDVVLPVVGFFLVGPFVILIVFTFFHLYLNKLWQHLSWLPAKFNDGSSLDSKIYPWVLSAPVDFNFPVLAQRLSPFNWISLAVTVISAWFVAPLTCIVFWYGYLRRHDWIGTSWQLFFIWVATLLALYFYEKSAEILNGTPEFVEKQPARFRSGVAFSVILIAAFLLMSIVAHSGPRIPHDFIYADLNGETLSNVKGDWDGERLGFVSGRNFSHASFHGAAARQVKMPKANLSNCDVDEANFESADLREANLAGAKFKNTVLSSARLDEIDFRSTSFDHCTLNDLTFLGVCPREDEREQAVSPSHNADPTIFKHIRMTNSSFDSSCIHEVLFSDFELTESCKIVNSLLDHCRFKRLKVLQRNSVFDSDFSECDFESAEFQAPIRRATFMNCKFKENSRIALMEGVKFADLTKQTLKNTLETVIEQRLALLSPTKRQQAAKVIKSDTVSDATFTNCILGAEAINTELKECEATFRDVVFSKISFVDTNFNSIDFSNVAFQNCDIKGGKFSGCSLVNCEFLKGNIQGVTFDNCKLSTRNHIYLKELERRGFVVLNTCEEVKEPTKSVVLQALLLSDIVPFGWDVVEPDEVRDPPHLKCRFRNKFHPDLVLEAVYEQVDPHFVTEATISSTSLSPENKNIGIIKYRYTDHGNEYTYCRAVLINLRKGKIIKDIRLPGYFDELEPEKWPKLQWSSNELTVVRYAEDKGEKISLND